MSAADQEQRSQLQAGMKEDILFCADCPVPCVGCDGGYSKIARGAEELTDETEIFREHLEGCKQGFQLRLTHTEGQRARKDICNNIRKVNAALKELPEKDYSWMFEAERNDTGTAESEGQYE